MLTVRRLTARMGLPFLLCAGCTLAAAAPTSQAREANLTAAAEPPRVMVTLAPAPPPIWSQITVDLARTYRLRIVWAWSLQTLGERCIVFDVPRDRPVEALLRRLAADPRVEIAQPLQRFATQATRAGAQPVPLQHSAQTLRLLQAHHWATGRGVRVAVIDTGIDVDHPELRGRIAKQRNFTESADSAFTSDIHGTAVAGVIVAALNSDIGLVGVAPQAQVFALKACWEEHPGAREAVCNSYTLAKAVDFAVSQGAQVLNFSLAGPPDPLLTKLIAAALARGVVVVAAQGPDSGSSFPASLPGVLAVAGSDDLQGGLRFPPRRLAPGTLCAPGVDILTTVPKGHYDFFSGSSFAAAQVSGVAALLLEHEPRLTPLALAALFHRTAHAIPAVPAAARTAAPPGAPSSPGNTVPAVAAAPGAAAPAGDSALSFDQVDACAALTESLGESGRCG